MDVNQLKNKLSEDSELIKKLLEEAMFNNVHVVSSKDIRCGWDDGNDSVSVNIGTLKASCYSQNIFGDIFTLLQKKLSLDFYDTFKWTCHKLGYTTSFKQKENTYLPFGGVYKRFSKDSCETDTYKIYDKSIIDEYGICPNVRFIKDNISALTQEKFNIGFDIESNRITVPWKDIFGNIVGIMGRFDGDYKKAKVAKWFPIISFEKSRFVFGLYENYHTIQQHDMIIIGESEKTSLVLDSYEMPYGVGLGGHSIQPQRADLIKATRVKNIIIILDEGLEENDSIEIAKQLKSSNSIYSNNVYYIYDKNNKYLKKDGKQSPYDLGYELFMKMLCDKECIVEYKGEIK